jgi:hypothetical protein
MTMTWAVTAVEGGTEGDIVADDVPEGICGRITPNAATFALMKGVLS